MKPPVPIPKRFPRSSVIGLIIAALLSVIWIAGDKRVQMMQYKWQKLLSAQSGTTSNPSRATILAMMHALELHSMTFTNSSGKLHFGHGVYTSYDEELQALLARWSEHQGWSTVGFDSELVVPRSNPFGNDIPNSDDRFQIFGFGIVKSSRQGELSTALTVPILYLILLACVPFVVTSHHRYRYLKRNKAGQCVCCGYVLGGVSTCPECGTATHPSGSSR